MCFAENIRGIVITAGINTDEMKKRGRHSQPLFFIFIILSYAKYPPVRAEEIAAGLSAGH